MQLMNKESLSLALELYKRAIDIDPQYAQAWAGLSFTHAIRIAYGHANYEDEYLPAKEAAEKALALDNQLPAAHDAMTWVYAALELKIQKAAPHILRAHELAPNDSAIIISRASWEMIMGNFDQSIRLFKKSIELDPLNPFAYRELGRVLFFAGQLEESLKMYNKVLEISPDTTSVHLGISSVYVLQGNFDEALRAIEKEKLEGYRYCGEAIAFYALGRQLESDQRLAALIAVGNHWSFQIATVYAFREQVNEAFEWLERAYNLHDAGIPITKVHPFMKPLHADPRWTVFIHKVGLAE